MASREETLAKIQRLRQLKALRDSRKSEPPTPRFVEQKLPEEAPPSYEDVGRFKRLKHGLALSGVETGLGIKGLFTDLSEENETVLKMMREDAQRYGGWSTAGNVLGDVAQMAVPMSALGKATKLNRLRKVADKAAKAGKIARAQRLGRAAKVAGAATLAGEVGIGAGFEAMQAPGEGRTRGDEAIRGGVGGLLGWGAGKVLGKAVDGVAKTDLAKHVGALGTRLTPGQAAKGGLPRAAEYAMGLLPFVARSVKDQKDLSESTFNLAMLKRAAAPGKNVTKSGQEGMRQLRSGYRDAYRGAWAKAKRVREDDLQRMLDDTLEGVNLGSDAIGPMKKIQADILRYVDDSSTRNLDLLDNRLRQEIARQSRSQYPNHGLKDLLEEMRENLRNAAGEETKQALAKINSKYGSFKVVEDAAGSRAGMSGGAPEGLVAGEFGPSALTSSIKSKGGTQRTAYGEAPLQTAALAGERTLGRKDPVPLMSFLRGAAQHLHIPGSGPLFGFGSDVAMGRTSGQVKAQQLAKLLRELGVVMPSVGAATNAQNKEE